MIRVNSWVRRVRVIELLFALKLYYNLALEILTIEQTKLVDQSTNKYMDPIFICVALLFTISQCSLMNYKKRNNLSDASNLGSYALNQRNMYLLMYWFIFQIQKLSSSSPIILFYTKNWPMCSCLAAATTTTDRVLSNREKKTSLTNFSTPMNLIFIKK